MISIAMTTYNGEKYVKEQLNSILDQISPPDEIIICDDCSTDSTKSILEYFSSQYPTIIKYYANDCNLGYRKNFRKAISLCSGNYIFLADQDDIWEKNKISEMIKKMDSDEGILVLATSYKYINQSGKPIGKERSSTMYQGSIKEDEIKRIEFNELLIHNYFQGCCISFRDSIKDDFLAYFTDIIPHDWLINIIAANENGLYFWNHPFTYYRIHDKNAIGVENLGKTKIEVFKEKMTLESRCRFANDGLRLIYALKQSGIPLDKNRLNFINNLDEFFKDFIIHMKLGKMISRKKYSCFYYLFRTKKGEMLDLIYCLIN